MGISYRPRSVSSLLMRLRAILCMRLWTRGWDRCRSERAAGAGFVSRGHQADVVFGGLEAAGNDALQLSETAQAAEDPKEKDAAKSILAKQSELRGAKMLLGYRRVVWERNRRFRGWM